MEKLRMTTPDLTAVNIDKLAEIFPNVITESFDDEGRLHRSVDFDMLRQELSDHVIDGGGERYQLSWPGKRAAAFAANAPIAKTLRPMREESVNFETTKNIFIEGDNLDALKLLQESYLDKIKLIYIDPPYNTGNDFIYKDNFAQSTAEYLASSGQADATGARLVANTESNGRFHSDWLSMMYPRLKLARNLLAEDGVILVSIDENEVVNLRVLLSEVFGDANFLNAFVWVNNLKGRQLSSSGAAGTKEYILCYARNVDRAPQFSVSSRRMKELMPSVYRGMSYEVKLDRYGPYVTKNELYNTNSAFNESTSPTLVYDIYYHPITGEVRTSEVSLDHRFEGFVKIPPHRNADGIHRYHAFRWSQAKVLRDYRDLEFVEKSGVWRVYTKIRDIDGMTLKDLLMDVSTVAGSKNIESLSFSKRLFDFPKPVLLLQIFVEAICDFDSIVLDFFAGSSATAHAAMAQNASDGGRRQFIMVQLDEVPDPKSEAAKQEYSSIAELSRERIRRAGKKILADSGKTEDDLDIGFRSFKVASTNMADVFTTPDALEQLDLDSLMSNIKPGRTGDDVLIQVMLAWGLELSLPIAVEALEGHTVHSVDGDALLACFDVGISPELIRAMAERRPLRAVFRDDAFETDAERVNAEQIFRELSPITDVKVL